MKRWPIAPKAHGAWLGAGAGIGLAQVVVGVIQGITRKPLDPGIVAGIYALSGPLLAFTGAWLMPHQSRTPVPAAGRLAELADALEASGHREFVITSTAPPGAEVKYVTDPPAVQPPEPRKPAIGDLRAGPGPGHPAEIFTGPGWETYQPEPAVQPEATTSGPTGKVTP